MRKSLKPVQEEAHERAKRILRKISDPTFQAVRPSLPSDPGTAA